MEIFIKDYLYTILDTVTGFSCMPMVIVTMVNRETTKGMAKAGLPMQTVTAMKVNGILIKSMDRANFYLLTVLYKMATG